MDANVEDKYISTYSSDGDKVAQIKATSVLLVESGHYTKTCLPIPSSGTGLSDRIGNKIRLKSLSLKGQIWPTNDSGGFANAYIKIMVVQVKTTLPTSTWNIGQMLDYNVQVFQNNLFAYPSLQLYDTTSRRDPKFRKFYRVLATRHINLAAEGSTANTGLHRSWNLNVDLRKLSKLIIDDALASNTLQNYDLRILALCDSGNQGSFALTVPVVGIPYQDAGTGFNISWDSRLFYEDA